MRSFFDYYFREKLPLTIFVFIIFVSGICFGAYGIKTVDYGLKKDLYDYFNTFIRDYNAFNQENNLLIWSGFKDNFLSFIIISISGFLVFTSPFIPFIIFLKGFVLGFSSSFFIMQYGYKGLLLAFLLIFPQNILLISAYIFTAVISINLSISIIKYYRGTKRFLKKDIEHMIANILFWALFIFAGVLIEIFLTPFLMKIVFKYLI